MNSEKNFQPGQNDRSKIFKVAEELVKSTNFDNDQQAKEEAILKKVASGDAEKIDLAMKQAGIKNLENISPDSDEE